MILVIIGAGLILAAAIMSIAGIIISIIDGFKESTMWGVLNLAGFICLGNIPNLIFCLMDLKTRHVPLVLVLGAILPAALGTYLLFVGGAIQSVQ